MKVHIDYLENKVEGLANKVDAFDDITDKVNGRA